jgi:hypothetical protein
MMLDKTNYKSLILSDKMVYCDSLLPHEMVVDDRKNTLIEYLRSLKPYLIIPSVLACNDSGVIIDGHHRYFALKEMGYEKIPVTFLNYQSKRITTHIDSDITKEQIISAATTRTLLPPKTSFHHFLDTEYLFQPIILLSSLVRLDQI